MLVLGFFPIFRNGIIENTDRYIPTGVAILTGTTIGYQVKINERWGYGDFFCYLVEDIRKGNYKGYYKE